MNFFYEKSVNETSEIKEIAFLKDTNNEIKRIFSLEESSDGHMKNPKVISLE